MAAEHKEEIIKIAEQTLIQMSGKKESEMTSDERRVTREVAEKFGVQILVDTLEQIAMTPPMYAHPDTLKKLPKDPEELFRQHAAEHNDDDDDSDMPGLDETKEQDPPQEAEETEEMKEVMEQQKRYMNAADAAAAPATNMQELHERVRKMVKLTSTTGGWADRHFYEQEGERGEKELTNLVLMFFRLEEYHYRVLDATYATVAAPTRKGRVRADNIGNRNTNDFIQFLKDFMKAAGPDINKIHMNVLAMRMKLETEVDSPLLVEYDRLLKLSYDVCSGMFSFKKDDITDRDIRDAPSKAADVDGVTTEDILASQRKDNPSDNGSVQVQMLSDYAFFVKSINQFDFLTLPESIRVYRLSVAYNILAIKIQRIFESLLRRRQQKGQTLSKQETEIYRVYQGRFSPFIEDDTIYTNRHVVRLNRAMMEVLHVFSTIFDNRLVGPDFLEKWADDDRLHFKSSRMQEFVFRLVKVSQRRKHLRFELERRCTALEYGKACLKVDEEVEKRLKGIDRLAREEIDESKNKTQE